MISVFKAVAFHLNAQNKSLISINGSSLKKKNFLQLKDIQAFKIMTKLPQHHRKVVNANA